MYNTLEIKKIITDIKKYNVEYIQAQIFLEHEMFPDNRTHERLQQL